MFVVVMPNLIRIEQNTVIVSKILSRYPGLDADNNIIFHLIDLILNKILEDFILIDKYTKIE